MRKIATAFLFVLLACGSSFGQLITTPREVAGTHVWTYSTNVAPGTSSITITNKPGEPDFIGSICMYSASSNVLTVSRVRTDVIPYYKGSYVDTNSPSISGTTTNWDWSTTNTVTYVTTNNICYLAVTNGSVVIDRDGYNLNGVETATTSIRKLYLGDYDAVVLTFGYTNNPIHIDVTAERY